MLENIKIVNLSQRKEEETIWCQNYGKFFWYHATKFFTENLLAIEMKKKQRCL